MPVRKLLAIYLREVKIQTERGILWKDLFPEEIEEGQEITFDAFNAGIVSDRIVSYEWNFGDGEKATGRKVIHIYRSKGRYRATLKITTDQGYSTTYIVGARVPPVIIVPVNPYSKFIAVWAEMRAR